MPISKQNLWVALFAILAVVAAAGVYGELESSSDVGDDPVARAASGTAAVVAGPGGPAESEGVVPLPVSTSAVALPAMDAPAPAVRSTTARRRTRSAGEGDVDVVPGEDPVATAANQLAARLESEPLDARWSSDAEARLVEHFAAISGGTALAEARCRSSVCRIELAFESEAARDDGVGSLSLPWDSVAVFQVDERDARNLVIYATRQPEDMRHG